MRSKFLLLLLLILLAPLCVSGNNSVRKSDLGRTPFVVGALKITITKFRGNVNFGDSKEVNSGQVVLQMENTSSEFATFYPQRFSFVSRDKTQTNILDVRRKDEEYLPFAEIRIAPQARVKETYRLNGRVRLPARLFYDDKLLAEISDQ